jgi:hypothetical protein
MQTNEAVKLWKELGITHANMEFSCGGDSMNDYHFTFYKKNDSKKKNVPEEIEVNSPELESYFDKEVFDEVEFYVNSDGHYIGEHGNVYIELDDSDEDEEEHTFIYSKSAKSEWSERIEETMEIKLSKKMSKFVSEYVSNINGEEGNCTINFKKDFIMSDEQEKLVGELEEIVLQETADFEPSYDEGEKEDYYTFTTNDGDDREELTIKDDKLLVSVGTSFIIYKED